MGLVEGSGMIADDSNCRLSVDVGVRMLTGEDYVWMGGVDVILQDN